MTVGYVSDDLTLYFLYARDSQKARNLARDDRVSLTIDHDVPASAPELGKNPSRMTADNAFGDPSPVDPDQWPAPVMT